MIKPKETTKLIYYHSEKNKTLLLYIEKGRAWLEDEGGERISPLGLDAMQTARMLEKEGFRWIGYL